MALALALITGAGTIRGETLDVAPVSVTMAGIRYLRDLQVAP